MLVLLNLVPTYYFLKHLSGRDTFKLQLGYQFCYLPSVRNLLQRLSSLWPRFYNNANVRTYESYINNSNRMTLSYFVCMTLESWEKFASIYNIHVICIYLCEIKKNINNKYELRLYITLKISSSIFSGLKITKSGIFT